MMHVLHPNKPNTPKSKRYAPAFLVDAEPAAPADATLPEDALTTVCAAPLACKARGLNVMPNFQCNRL
jgi:hypothetical protein